jgi:hypothetical protein
MSTLAEHIVETLAAESIEVTVDSVQAAIDSFEEPPAKKAVAKKVVAKKATTVHTCEYTVNGKEETYICGKTAKNEHDGMWYCGTATSGHYKSASSKPAAKAKAKAKATPKAAKATAAKSKAVSLVNKVTKKVQIAADEVSPGVWADLAHFRLAINQDTKEVYGIVDEDNETILPLTEEALAFVEAHGITIQEGTETTPAPKSKTLAAKAKVAPKSKAVPAKTSKVAPKSKAVPKSKSVEPTEEDDTTLEELQQNIEEALVEPETDEVAENVEEETDVTLELEEEEPAVEENVEGGDEEQPDIEETDEGEALEEEPEEEEEAGEDE